MNYEKLLEAANLIQQYIVESEMGGQFDADDSYAQTYNDLEDLKEKFEEEGDL